MGIVANFAALKTASGPNSMVSAPSRMAAMSKAAVPAEIQSLDDFSTAVV